MNSENSPGRAILIGDVCVDLIIRVPEETGNARQQPEPEVHGGGAVANTAVALARLGVDTQFIGAVGNELFGDQARRELEMEGIDISRLVVSRRWPTMLVIGLIDRTGQRTVLGWPNRNQAFSDLHADRLAGLDPSPRDWLHTSGGCLVQEPSRAAMHKALDLARDNGAKSSFDLNLRLGLEGGPDAARLQRHGVEGRPQGRCRARVRRRGAVPPDTRRTGHEGGHGTPGLTNQLHRDHAGEHRGAPMFRNSGRPRSPFRPSRVPVLDTIGAGDAFDAGFIQAGLEGCSLSEQVRRGHAVAALQIGKPGGAQRTDPIRSGAVPGPESAGAGNNLDVGRTDLLGARCNGRTRAFRFPWCIG